MRVAVIFFEGKNRNKVLEITRSLAQGIEEKGHSVDIIDGDRDISTKLTIYQYIAVGTTALTNYGGKIPENVTRFLSSAGVITGKRCFAYIVKGGLRIMKTLSTLMGALEHEGMYLKYSEVLSSNVEAAAVGRRLHIDQS